MPFQMRSMAACGPPGRVAYSSLPRAPANGLKELLGVLVHAVGADGLLPLGLTSSCASCSAEAASTVGNWFWSTRMTL